MPYGRREVGERKVTEPRQQPVTLFCLFVVSRATQLRIESNTQQTNEEHDAEEIDDDLPVGETCI